MSTLSKFAKTTALPLALAIISSGCAARYAVRSYPEGATVYVKNVVTQEKKVVGKTPLDFKKTSEIGDVFFLQVEKENFFPKNLLLTPKNDENLTIDVTLDPMTEAQSLAQKKEGEQGQPPQDKDKKKEGEDLNLRVALLENTLTMYKDALFSGRYAGGVAPYDRDRTDSIVGHLFKAQQQVGLKQYDKALAELDQAILKDEYSSQPHVVKGSVLFMKKQYSEAKTAWERALRIDPYNAQVYQYLRLVSKKMGTEGPPEHPGLLRAPASGPWSQGLRE